MLNPAEKIWDHERQRRNRKLDRAASALGGSLRDKVVTANKAVQLLEAVIEPHDRVCLEGNNQKQADFLAQSLTRVDPARVNKLHMLQSVLALPEHLDLYELGIAEQVDFSFSGPQAARLARMLQGRFAGIDARSVDDFRTLDGMSSWLSKHAQQT